VTNGETTCFAGAQAVEAFYGALRSGRLDAALSLLAKDARWIDPKGFPNGGRLRGAAEVKARVFEPIAADWSSFAVDVDRIVPSADGTSVLALGRYSGRHRKTARVLDVPFAHVWSTLRGELTRFETFTDTAAIHGRDGRSPRRRDEPGRTDGLGGAPCAPRDRDRGRRRRRARRRGWRGLLPPHRGRRPRPRPAVHRERRARLERFSGGLAAAALGALIHFGLAYGFTAAFVLAWTRIRAVRRHWVSSGVVWGAAVWAFMNVLVLPLSRVAPSSITLLAALHGVVGHALFAGLSAAIVARRIVGAGGEAA
jgi:ketosteroid isomerase-like protein